jgi:hypothetical protein
MGRVRSGRIVNASLCKKGFLKESDSDHIRYYFLKKNSKDCVVKTKMSHGMMGQTLSIKLLSDMARQLRLTKTQFLDLIDCRLSEKEYRQILQNYGEDV